MKTVGIVCEYNPFHRGHAFQIEQIRKKFGEDTQIVALMSGDFVQRGEPAVYDKYMRARTAIESSVNLVLELPFPYSCSSAEQFACGAVRIFKKCGCIDTMCFGTEGKKEEKLWEIAQNIRKKEFQKKKAELRKTCRNLSYPKLVDRCYKECFGEELSLLSNEILGICYCLAIQEEGNPFDIFVSDMLEEVSATKERSLLLQNRECKDFASLENGERAILSMLSLKKSEQQNRFLKNAKNAASLETLFRQVRSATDTDAKLKRELIYTLLDVKKGTEKQDVCFTVVLAADSLGEKLLRAIRKTGNIEIINKKAKGVCNGFALYLLSERLYSVFTSSQHEANYLMKMHPYIKKEEKVLEKEIKV